VYDGQGRHTGFNPSTSQIENQIPGSNYNFNSDGTVSIIIPSDLTQFRIVIDGTQIQGTIAYNVYIEKMNSDNTGISRKISETITSGTTQEFSLDLLVDTFTITVSAGANGQITPGTGSVSYGATPTYSIMPNAGYHIESIIANGASVTVTNPKGSELPVCFCYS